MLFLSTLLISMFITMALIPILRMAAVRLHAGLDLPDPRKVHDHPVPKVGGLAMAAGALLPVLLVADGGAFINSVLIGAWIIVVFGMVDDIKGLGWKAKFAGQLAAALVVVLYGGLKICFLGSCLPQGIVVPDLFSLPLTLLVIVGVTNAINLSDGLDGLAGGTSLLVFIGIGLMCYTGGEMPEKLFIMILCTAVAGAIFGFLRFNTYPATVFMGDSGSQLLGFLAVTLSLGITQLDSTPVSPFVPLLLLGFPVLDTITVMAERIGAGRSPFVADKNHIHHKLMRMGLFHTEAVVVVYAITAALTGAAYLLRYHSEWLLLFCYLTFCALVVSALTAAERRGLRFSRTGPFDIEVKGRLKVLKEKRVLIQVSFGILHLGLPLLFVVTALIPAGIPGYVSAIAAGFMAAIVGLRLMRREWLAALLRLIFYISVPFLLRVGQEDPAAWIAPHLLKAYGIAFGVLALFMVLTLKSTQRRAGFKTSPMDFLVLLIALVLPNLPDPVVAGFKMGELAVKIIVFFFGFEVLIGELRGELRWLAWGMLGALGLLVVRGLA
jgi:UDP-GlcNAc:undecaprenyl-phosphate GlcNAc-1-phosphate transferase